MLGKIEGRRRRGRQRMRWLDGITDSKDMSSMAELGHNRHTGLSQIQGKPVLAEEQGGLVHRQRARYLQKL